MSSSPRSLCRSPRCSLLLLVFAVTFLARPGVAEEVVHVPADVASLQTAIDTVPDGGTIELAAGTYASPGGGFLILNEGKAFTIRGAEGSTVVLDGGGTREVLFFSNTSVGTTGPVVFENLIFRNGLTTTNSTGGGVTLIRAEATFVDCRFEDNRAEPSQTGGGGVGVFTDSVATFLRSTFTGNSASREAGALKVGGESVVYVHESVFTDNDCNQPGHRVTAAGGAIHVGNATLRVSNSRFERNEAGFVGGAIYTTGTFQVPYSIPRSDVIVSNCYFADNRAINDPGVTTNSPTEGGAVASENQSVMRIYNSRFVDNDARHGGAVGIYRGAVEIYDSVFRGNFSTATGQGSRFGGTFKVTSNDTSGDTDDFPTGRLTVMDSFVLGRIGGATADAEVGGCLFAQGDVNRAFGQGGVGQSGTLADHRAEVTLERSAFIDCDAVQNGASQGHGGGVNTVLTDLVMRDTLVIDSSAEDQGGALRVVTGTSALLERVTLAGNSADIRGAGIYGQGAELTIVDSQFLANEVSPGTNEAANQSFGGGMYTTHQTFSGDPLNMEGTVTDSLFSGNIGLPIYDGDQTVVPYNDMQYNGNTLASPIFGALVYRDPVNGGAIDVPSLNGLVISRDSGVPSTNKSLVNNTYQGSEATAGLLLAVPPEILDTLAAGEPGGQTTSYLVWGWAGGSATLDGLGVGTKTGWQEAGSGIHTLSVDGQDFMAEVSAGPIPGANLTASPSAIDFGGMSTLSWTTPGGATFLDAALDQGLGSDLNATGSMMLSPIASTTYRYCAVTEEGGAVAEVTIFVGESGIFSDGFESGDTSAWSASNP